MFATQRKTPMLSIFAAQTSNLSCVLTSNRNHNTIIPSLISFLQCLNLQVVHSWTTSGSKISHLVLAYTIWLEFRFTGRLMLANTAISYSTQQAGATIYGSCNCFSMRLICSCRFADQPPKRHIFDGWEISEPFPIARLEKYLLKPPSGFLGTAAAAAKGKHFSHFKSSY